MTRVSESATVPTRQWTEREDDMKTLEKATLKNVQEKALEIISLYDFDVAEATKMEADLYRDLLDLMARNKLSKRAITAIAKELKPIKTKRESLTVSEVR